VDRRQVLKGTMAGALTLWASPLLMTARAAQQAGAAAGVKKLTDRISVIDAGTNVLVLSATDGLLLVDTGAPKSGDKLAAALKGVSNAKVNTVFNTHYHLDQTANNEMFSAAGAKIVAHSRTQQWMANDYWIPEELRFEKARPKGALPTQTFFNTDSMKVGNEQIDYGYLLDAHTGGDAYVYFKDSNVLAVGDVASPVRDPELDWITGAWIGKMRSTPWPKLTLRTVMFSPKPVFLRAIRVPSNACRRSFSPSRIFT